MIKKKQPSCILKIEIQINWAQELKPKQNSNSFCWHSEQNRDKTATQAGKISIPFLYDDSKSVSAKRRGKNPKMRQQR